MCGIAGFCNMPERWRDNIQRMNDAMRHRGPDAEGVWSADDSNVVFGHRRLSIVDLSPAGSQPMISLSGRYVILLNGEIYNYRAIAKKLMDEGRLRDFRGHSDTEVLLEAIEAYGFEAAVKMAKGMFAIAVYDREEKRLFLARDRMGEKPLYYGFFNGRFVFASDITAVRENLYFTDEIDRDALALYFRYGYLPAPYTVYLHVKKLEAGGIAELNAPFTEIRIHKYWDIAGVARERQNHLFSGTEKEAADELEKILKEAVSGQMAADVPVGAFLSGGVDSTTVVAMMQSETRNKIKTFSIGFENGDFNEAQYAKETAEYLGTDHTELYVGEQEAAQAIPELASVYGEPFADPSQIPTLLVSRLARRQVTVSLSGDGGDELFCGYHRYGHVNGMWNKIKGIPFPLRRGIGSYLESKPWNSMKKLRLIGHYLSSETSEQLYERTGNTAPGTDALVINSTIPEFQFTSYKAGHLDSVQENMMLIDQLLYLPDDILTKVDRSGMAVSLESRIPFLDKDVVEYAWSLPLSYKSNHGVEKKVLKDVLYRYVPESMMNRSKRGFSVPIFDWIKRGELREWAEGLLEERAIKNQGILDEKIVRRMWKDFIEKGSNERIIWYLLMFQEWTKGIKR